MLLRPGPCHMLRAPRAHSPLSVDLHAVHLLSAPGDFVRDRPDVTHVGCVAVVFLPATLAPQFPSSVVLLRTADSRIP
jgi:hypothetical protein